MKKSKRQRYIEYWNGPDSWARRKKARKTARAQRGKGDMITRACATAYFCRFQGWFPKDNKEFNRLCGYP